MERFVANAITEWWFLLIAGCNLPLIANTLLSMRRPISPSDTPEEHCKELVLHNLKVDLIQVQ